MALCYKDMTFCSVGMNGCTNKTCRRYMTEKMMDEIKQHPPALPFAFSDFSPNCDEYTPKKKDV